MPDISHQQLLDAINGVETRLAGSFTRQLSDTNEELTGTFRKALTITKQEIVTGVTEQLSIIADDMTTKHDLQESEQRLTTVMATKLDLQKTQIILERKTKSNQNANIQHHLATRDQIGQLNRQFGNLIEGLTQAVDRNS